MKKILLLLSLFLVSPSLSQTIDPPTCSISGSSISCPNGLLTPGSGSVTSVSVTTQNGVSATVTNPTTTPALAFSLGAISPSTVAISGATLGLNASAAGGMYASISGSGSSPGFYTYLTGDTVARVRIGMDSANIPSLAFGAGGASTRDTFLYRSGVGALVAGTTTTLSDASLTLGSLLSAGQISGSSFVPTSSTIPTNGVYLAAANTLGFATNSTNNWRMTSNFTSFASSSGPILLGQAASSTAPTFAPTKIATTTGIGSQAAGNISLIAEGLEVTRILSGSTVQISGQSVMRGYTVGTLPTGITGGRVYITDQLTACAAIGVAPTGGGVITCPVFFNGSAWVSG